MACGGPILVGRLAISMMTYHATEDGSLLPTCNMPLESYAICSKDCAVAVLDCLTHGDEEPAMKSKKKKPKKGY
jgi:hypothetical protein